MKEIDQTKIQKAVKMILEAIGENPDREGLIDTPKRVANMYEEICAGYNDDEKIHLAKTFDVSTGNIVIEKDITFTSTCEHHLFR